ncbi:hypothetical protein [Sulfuracidifex tepidarius]|uniref:Cytochrome C oxidase assembly protein n=1 Tax=Sulfuracidifex tepidarius TaxID=1294262 RepID=A0A510DX09_9CREN|nr:hypothetical protein [Sulfuracidifex tepidarius]BBG24747.1 hypothetical protein IC006_2081 [Sulfuracidifex tepidarius]BBG27536.1 hypothetical protein IC007_2090 [Sulfuracidifex tepidarius]
MILPYLALLESIFAGINIVLGGVVEGYGYGLSLGTKWPYTRNMMEVASQKDPEALHRIMATVVGLLSLFLLIFFPSPFTEIGFASIVATALLGMATLYVLAGKLPSVFQGIHDIAAYTTFVTYFLLFLHGEGYFNVNVTSFLIEAIVPPHFLYFVIFMGGVVTGTRRMREKIGDVLRVHKRVAPKAEFSPAKRPDDSKTLKRLQIAWGIHGILAVIFVIAVVLLHYWFTLGTTLGVIIVGLWVFKSINRSPTKPGASIATHQFFSLLTVVAIILNSLGLLL